MIFAGAGHPPALLVSKGGGVRRLASQHGILGCLAEVVPSESQCEIDFRSGDRLLLYTDGLVEVFNRRDEMLGVEGLEGLVGESVKRSLPEMRRTILDGVATWGQGPLADDVSLIIVELR